MIDGTSDLKTLLAAATLFVSIAFGNLANAADPAAWPKKTYTYKTVDDTKIEADFFRPDDQVTRPLVVWIHGGALIMGNRDGIPGNIREMCQKEGIAMASIDYRLAPEVKLPAIIEDLRDAFRWIRASASDQLRINPNKIAVAGGSAGGYMTLMAGVVVDPPPTALVSYYGYGDVDGDWYKKPSEHYRTTSALVAEADARAGVGKGVLTGTGFSPEFKGRRDYYLYLRQNGLWTEEVTGFNPFTEKAKLDPYCPVRNVTSKYPPTLLVHGTADTDVPYELSVDMDRALTEKKIPHEFITVPDGNHGLSKRNTTADPAVIDKAHARVAEFIRTELTK